jgi:methylated-DNA-[protein]-cysteine S-methyltransferase
LGWIGIAITERGLAQLTLPQNSEKEALAALSLSSYALRVRIEHIASTVSRIQDYCNGHAFSFNETLDLSAGSTFEQRVWNTCLTIPYGQTRSYGWLAAQLGQPKAARAVGNALGKNPVPIIIPCHRVIAANGSIGGFSGGIETKKRLLALESIMHFRC